MSAHAVISVAVKHLAAAGVTGASLVTAIEEMTAAAESRKSSAAKRMVRYRQRLKDRNARDVTRYDEHIYRNNTTNNNTDSKIIDMPSVTRDVTRDVLKKSHKRSAKTPFPEGWLPDDLAPDDVPEFDRFRDHALKNDSRYANWLAAWRNWKTSPYRKNGGAVGSSRPVSNAGGGFASIAARLRAADRPRNGTAGDFEQSG